METWKPRNVEASIIYSAFFLRASHRGFHGTWKTRLFLYHTMFDISVYILMNYGKHLHRKLAYMKGCFSELSTVSSVENHPAKRSKKTPRFEPWTSGSWAWFLTTMPALSDKDLHANGSHIIHVLQYRAIHDVFLRFYVWSHFNEKCRVFIKKINVCTDTRFVLIYAYKTSIYERIYQRKYAYVSSSML